MRKSRAEKSGKIQIHNIILNFPALDFLIWKIQKAGNSKFFLLFFTLFFYIPYTLDVVETNNIHYITALSFILNRLYVLTSTHY